MTEIIRCAVCRREMTYHPVAGMCRSCANKGRTTYWTRERVIEAFQRWAEVYGGPPVSGMWRRAGEWWPSMPTVVEMFGTWNAAIIEAGLEPFTLNGRQARQLPWVEAGWGALEARGITRKRNKAANGELLRPRREWTDEEIIEALQRWVREHGGPPTVGMWVVSYGWWPAATTVSKHFGGWNKALETAGIPPRPQGGMHEREPHYLAGWATVRAARREMFPPQERKWRRNKLRSEVSGE